MIVVDKKFKRPVARTTGLSVTLSVQRMVRGYLLTIFGILSLATTNSLRYVSC